MKAESKKQKGARFERFIAKEITNAGLGEAHRELLSGGGWRKGDISANIPFILEAKNWKKIKILEWIKQAKREAQVGNYDKDSWAVIFKDPESPEANPVAYAVIDFWKFLELLKKNEEPKIKEPDKNMKWHLTNLKNAINQVLKDLD